MPADIAHCALGEGESPVFENHCIRSYDFVIVFNFLKNVYPSETTAREELLGKQCQHKAWTFIWLQGFCDSVPYKIRWESVGSCPGKQVPYKRRHRLARLFAFSRQQAWARAVIALTDIREEQSGGLQLWKFGGISLLVLFHRSHRVVLQCF